MDASEIKGQIDFGIITIREDEFRAVLKRFPKRSVAKGRRHYNVGDVDARNGDRYTTAVVRCLEQGIGEAQNVATDLIEELSPQWIIVVGIAGGMPAHEFTLGDVVVSTRVYDFSVGAVQSDGSRTYSTGGGPLHPAVGGVVANLAGMEDDLGDWASDASIGAPRPPVSLDPGQLYGNDAWREKTLSSLRAHFEGTPARSPLVTAGAIASSDQLLKNTDIASEWLQSARQILAVEMESAGVYRVANSRGVPALSIRGISDIVGLKRDPRWTPYACNTAAAFARAFVCAGPIEARVRRSPSLPAAAQPSPRIASPVKEASAPIERAAEPAGRPEAKRSGSARRDQVFISFTDNDRDTLSALKEALRPLEQQGLLATWDATMIRPGEVIAEKTRAAIESAKVAVLLVSSRFLASQAHEREVAALLSAGVPLLCLYVDFSLVDLASYSYTDPKTRERRSIRLVELGALNEHERPLRSLSASEKGATLMRSVKKILEAARPQE